jgi:hypothetical protein
VLQTIANIVVAMVALWVQAVPAAVALGVLLAS